MKHLLIILEGMADVPQAALDGKTPLATARAPHLSALAASGACGTVRLPRDLRAYRPTATLGAMLGVPIEAAREFHRAPFEALAASVPVLVHERIFRANFVTLREEQMVESAVPLSLDETVALCEALEPVASRFRVRLDALRPGQLLALFHHPVPGEEESGVPPHAVAGKEWKGFLPAGADARDFFEAARELLERHPVNEVRIDLGENPANALWLWGGGGEPAVPRVFGGLPLKACMITNSLMARGMARAFRMSVGGFRDPSSPTGPGTALDVPVAVSALRDHDLAVVYIAARAEIGGHGGPRDKALALQALDFHVIGPLVEIAATQRPCRILVATDACVDSSSGRAAEGTLPFLLSGDGVVPDDCSRWDETACSAGRLGAVELAELFETLLLGGGK